ncbi:3-deoxy-D-manno-octulosonic acid transferase [Marinilabiliaceae bacterium JC017]|nr:3-deoxy-D-manno-octulosonic acid transferase [Marinilabiliaceae bacterium JC017]
MITPLYNIGIGLMTAGLKLAAIFNEKARLLVNGRKQLWRDLETAAVDGPTIWVHAASLGEFEQGRPLIEAIKKKHPEKKIVLTFFSPSGYEIRKDYELADYVFYLPADTQRKARKFIEKINPEVVFFIKYEFWYHFLTQLKRKNIPVYGVSVIFRSSQAFFKWYGGWFRRMLKAFEYFYVQDEVSGQLLNKIGLKNYTVAGDTRFDRVAEIAAASKEIDLAKQFAGESKVIVAGSTWPGDEKILLKYINEVKEDVKLIIAPHVIGEEHIKQIEAGLQVKTFRYTNAPENPQDYKVMIVNTMGMLSAIYKYGQVAYIGGGFGSGIHNTLEAATYSMPVIFGPNYKKYKEACDLVDLKAGFEIVKGSDFDLLMGKFWEESGFLSTSGVSAGAYVAKMCGATSLIMDQVIK